MSHELAAHHSLVLKADNMAEKMEWMAKLRGCIESPKNDSSTKSGSMKESKSTDNVAAALLSSASDGPVVNNSLCHILWTLLLLHEFFQGHKLHCITEIGWYGMGLSPSLDKLLRISFFCG